MNEQVAIALPLQTDRKAAAGRSIVVAAARRCVALSRPAASHLRRRANGACKGSAERVELGQTLPRGKGAPAATGPKRGWKVSINHAASELSINECLSFVRSLARSLAP